MDVVVEAKGFIFLFEKIWNIMPLRKVVDSYTWNFHSHHIQIKMSIWINSVD